MLPRASLCSCACFRIPRLGFPPDSRSCVKRSGPPSRRRPQAALAIAMMLPTYLPRREWDAIACATSLLTLSMRRKSAHQMTNYAANRRRKRKGTMTSRGYCDIFSGAVFGDLVHSARHAASDRTLKPTKKNFKTSDVGKRRKVP